MSRHRAPRTLHGDVEFLRAAIDRVACLMMADLKANLSAYAAGVCIAAVALLAIATQL